ncbi:MAG TPA: hypothetical protein VME21_13110 [Steroidobacteraceae bacterium]|nr:hypothetical protein [Steroidobacteraceae bacterium]
MSPRLLVTGATAYEAQVIEDLKTEGVHVSSLARLLPSEPYRDTLERVRALLDRDPPRVSPAWIRRASSTDLSPQALLERLPELYMVGLSEPLLRIAELYLRLPVAYHGAVLRHSLVDRGSTGPRLWHQDAEDLNVLRVVIYLNDVTSGGGPFEYIPRGLGVTYRRFSKAGGPLTSEVVERIVPPASWKRVIAPAGTVILADTAKTFHHESLQTESERSVMMLGYSSRSPTGAPLAQAHFQVEQVAGLLARIVPVSQHEHVFGWRRRLSQEQPAVAAAAAAVDAD